MSGEGKHKVSAPSIEHRENVRRLWLVITRPDKLPSALLAADALAARFPGGCHLLLERTHWWDAVRWPASWRARFHAIHDFARVPTCRGLRDLPRLIAALRERRAVVHELGVAQGDLIVCFAGLTRLANAVVSAFPLARKLLCVPERKLLDLLAPVDRRAYRWTAPGWLQNRVAEPLAGLHRTLDFKRRDGCGGDGARRVRFAWQPGEIFHACLAFTDQQLPAGGSPSETKNFPTVRCRFPDVRALLATPANHEKRRAVIFFGTPFLLVRNLPVKVYATHLLRCLEAISRWFPEHEKIYRPHPAETTESALLDLPAHGFRRESDGLVAELYFLENFARIAAVFSVSSTASRRALELGLNAYTLWRTFPFQPAQRAFFAAAAEGLPEAFEVHDLSSPPRAHAECSEREQTTAGALPSFVEALQLAADCALRAVAFHS